VFAAGHLVRTLIEIASHYPRAQYNNPLLRSCSRRRQPRFRHLLCTSLTTRTWLEFHEVFQCPKIAQKVEIWSFGPRPRPASFRKLSP
jgi:hypothetical protein